MIPDQNGLSVLRGALTTMLKISALFFRRAGLSAVGFKWHSFYGEPQLISVNS
jgi:hypothetical protein